MTFVPNSLKRWTCPENYFGAEWPDYFSSGVGQSEESDPLERSNFESMLEALAGESETVIVVRETHWRLGWVEWIAIHQDDDKVLEIADRIAARNPGGKPTMATDSTRSPKANSSTSPGSTRLPQSEIDLLRADLHKAADEAAARRSSRKRTRKRSRSGCRTRTGRTSRRSWRLGRSAGSGSAAGRSPTAARVPTKPQPVAPVCTENSNTGVVVMKSAEDGA
jgi:hypothetical protein